MQVIHPNEESRSDPLSQTWRKTPTISDANTRSAHKQYLAKQWLKPNQQKLDQHKNLHEGPEGKPPPLLQTNTENR